MSDKNTKLYRAVESGDVKKVRRLLQLGAVINYKHLDDLQKLPLHCAAANGHSDVATLLLSKGANIEAAQSDKWTPLHFAANNGHLEVAKLLLSNGANIEATNKDEATPLHYTARYGHLEMVKLLLSNGAYIEAAQTDKWTPLHFVANNGHLEVAKLLLSNGAKIEATNNEGWTPLHYVSYNGHFEVAKLLLSNRANIEATNKYGWTPLHCAARNGHLQVAKLLLSNGAKIEATSINGWTPLHYAAKRGRLEVALLLLTNGAIVEAANKVGRTPLHLAAKTYLEEERGASLDCVCKYRDVPSNHDSSTPTSAQPHDDPIIEFRRYLEESSHFKIFVEESGVEFQSFVPNPHAAVGTPLYQNFCQAVLSCSDQRSSSKVVVVPDHGCLAIVFHGTSPQNIEDIQKTGLDPTQRKVQVYGPGEYFSKNPSHSVSYCNGGLSMLVFLVVVPTRSEHLQKQYPNIPIDFVVVDEYQHQLPLGVLHFGHVNEGALARSHRLRQPLKQLSTELSTKKNKAVEAQTKALIIQLLIQDKWDLAQQKYERYFKRLKEESKREISMYVHHAIDAAVVPVLFPNLPEPYNRTDFDSRQDLATVETYEAAAQTAKAKLDKYVAAAQTAKAKSNKNFRKRSGRGQRQSNNQKTPLHVAARYGHLEMVKLLLSDGANIEAADENKVTPLSHAAHDGHLEVAELLLSSGANIEAAEIYNWTPLHYAAKYGHLEVATLLLSNGANIEATDNGQWTPLHHAAKYGHLEVATLLLSNGANIEATDNGKWTPLHHAAKYGHLEVAKLLLSNGAYIEATTKDGWTPLHYAAYCGHLEVVKYLVEENGASLDVKDNYGDTALNTVRMFRCQAEAVLLENWLKKYKKTPRKG